MMSKEKQDRFLAVYEPVHDRFERFCRARAYGEMDFKDLINDSLLIAYERFETLRSEQAFLSFLFGIAVRIISNHQRKKSEVAHSEEHVSIADKAQENFADGHFLHLALAQLPVDQKECVILFEISGFKIKEIAEIQAVSEDAVKQRLKRGRERLQEILTYVAKPHTNTSH
jgi:RNA polymerase sigma-70 factor (ECF subfamily)